MTTLGNPKHERFAQEIAKGKSQVEAHKLAGYRPNKGNAAALAGRSEIQCRVQELMDRAAARTEVTIDSLIEDAKGVYQAAIADKQLAAANGALRLISELTGNLVKRTEDLTHRYKTREEIEARIRELLSKQYDNTSGPEPTLTERASAKFN